MAHLLLRPVVPGLADGDGELRLLVLPGRLQQQLRELHHVQLLHLALLGLDVPREHLSLGEGGLREEHGGDDVRDVVGRGDVLEVLRPAPQGQGDVLPGEHHELLDYEGGARGANKGTRTHEAPYGKAGEGKDASHAG